MTDRQQVAEVLEEIAFLLDLLGENPFKSRAYENAARVLRAFDGDLDSAVRSGEIKRVKGIGVALADKIKTLVLTGELPYLDGLRLQVPQGLLDWLRIPGLGPKKARGFTWLSGSPPSRSSKPRAAATGFGNCLASGTPASARSWKASGGCGSMRAGFSSPSSVSGHRHQALTT